MRSGDPTQADDRPRGWLETLLPCVRRRRLLRALGATFAPNGRDEYLYREGERCLPIYAERLAGEYDVEVRAIDAVGHWLPPHDREALDDERRRAILALFLRYLAILDQRVLLVPDGAAHPDVSPSG